MAQGFGGGFGGRFLGEAAQLQGLAAILQGEEEGVGIGAFARRLHHGFDGADVGEAEAAPAAEEGAAGMHRPGLAGAVEADEPVAAQKCGRDERQADRGCPDGDGPEGQKHQLKGRNAGADEEVPCGKEAEKPGHAENRPFRPGYPVAAFEAVPVDGHRALHGVQPRTTCLPIRYDGRRLNKPR